MENFINDGFKRNGPICQMLEAIAVTAQHQAAERVVHFNGVVTQ